MITKAEARRIAAAHIGEHEETPDGVTPVIVDTATVETDFCWFFFYESEEYLLTGSFSNRLAGNGPIVVDRDDGAVSTIPTYATITQHIEDYCAERRTRLPDVTSAEADPPPSVRRQRQGRISSRGVALSRQHRNARRPPVAVGHGAEAPTR
jgi:hypothetical protein